MSKQIFVNLPVRDLKQSKNFFTKLGFTFNPQFDNDNAACMIINEGNSYVMFFVEAFFKKFIEKDLSDYLDCKEVFTALSTDSKEKVDELMNKALYYGASEARKTQDYGFMYRRSFIDLDGHIWEIFWWDMD